MFRDFRDREFRDFAASRDGTLNMETTTSNREFLLAIVTQLIASVVCIWTLVRILRVGELLLDLRYWRTGLQCGYAR